MQENKHQFGIKPEYRKDYEEIKALLLSDEGREDWHFDHLMRTFEDCLQTAMASTYSDGRIAFLGAYSSVLDVMVVKEVMQCFSEGELKKLGEYYRHQNYLSPIYGMLASQIEIHFDSLARRHIAATVEKLPFPIPLAA